MYRKPACFFLLITAFSLASSAQFSKGMRMAGGQITGFFESGKNDYEYSTTNLSFTSNSDIISLDLSPSIGWFISDKTVIGARITGGYRFEKYIDTENGVAFRKREEPSVNILLGLFARNYFSTSGKFYPFAQVNLDAGILSSTTKGYYYDLAYKETYDGKLTGGFTAKAGIQAGISRMLTDHIALDIIAGYTFTSQKKKFKTTFQRDVGYDGTIDETEVLSLSNTITNHGVTIGAGFQIFLGKKK